MGGPFRAPALQPAWHRVVSRHRPVTRWPNRRGHRFPIQGDTYLALWFVAPHPGEIPTGRSAGSPPTHQLAACWVVITGNDTFVFTSNTASGTITGFRVQRNGGLTILDAQGVSANTGSGSTPTDLALSENSRFLFSLNPGAGNVAGWRIAEDGSLLFTGVAQGIPASASGIAAR